MKKSGYDDKYSIDFSEIQDCLTGYGRIIEYNYSETPIAPLSSRTMTSDGETPTPGGTPDGAE